MVHSHEKPGGYSRGSIFLCIMIDRTTAQIEVLRKSPAMWLSYRGVRVFTQQYICMGLYF